MPPDLWTWPAVDGWAHAAEDSRPRLLVVDPGPDFEDLLAAAEEVLEEELATPVLPVYGDDEVTVVALLDLLTGELHGPDGSGEAPADLLADAADATAELTDLVLVTTDDEALVERVRLGLSLSRPSLRRAVLACWRGGHLALALPVTADGLGARQVAELSGDG